MCDPAPCHQRHLMTMSQSQSGNHFTVPCVPAARVGMLLLADIAQVCGAPAPAPHRPSSDPSSSWYGFLAPSLCSGCVSAQAFWGVQQVMVSDSMSSPSLCHCISADEAKSCFLQSPLVSLVDGMPGLSCPGQRISLAQCRLGTCFRSWSRIRPRAVFTNGNPPGFIVFEAWKHLPVAQGNEAGRIRVWQHLPFVLCPSWAPFGAQPCQRPVPPIIG